jgi:MscS family membrane protein
MLSTLYKSTRIFQQLFLLVFVLFSVTPPALSQEAAKPDVSAREVLEASQESDKVMEEKEESDSQGIEALSTPLNALLKLRKAVEQNDYEIAGEFLDRRYQPEELEQISDEDLLKALGYVFNQQNMINLADVSDHPQGELNDGLPSYRDQIGTVILSDREVPIYLQRVPDGKGGRAWKLSNATVAEIPEMWDELGYSPVAEYLQKVLPDIKFMGMDNWQLLATVFFFVLAWPIATVVSYLLRRLALMIPNRFPMGITNFFKGPMRFFLFIMIARLLIGQLGLSLKARVFLQSSGMDFIAWTILLLGLMSLLRDYQIRKMQYAGNAQYVALIKPFTTIMKVIVVTIIALYWAKTAGYDMSTILAGLGVGSLAVALAAQKTLENVIGAVTLYTARPVSAGDFCRFGNTLGTVEEIGLRSTLIRTLNRTMVVVPNSMFSSVEIENFSDRDRIRYFRQFRLRLETAEQIRFILAELRRTFLAHPELLQDTVSIRFENIVEGNALLRLDAGVETTDFQEFLAVAEDLNLRIVEVVQEAGGRFTGPEQQVQLGEAAPGDPDRVANIEATLREWREQDRLPFPDYSEQDIAELRGTLDYPPKGSPG